MKVIKRDGTTVDFDSSKIVVAIQKANAVVDPQDRIEEYNMNPYFRYRVYHHVYFRVNNAKNIGMQAIATEKARQGGSGGRSGGFGGGSSFGGGGRGGSFR